MITNRAGRSAIRCRGCAGRRGRARADAPRRQPFAAAVARVAGAEFGPTLRGVSHSLPRLRGSPWQSSGRRSEASAVGAVARVAVAELVLAARATGARGVAPDLGELVVAGRFGAPLDLAAAVRAWRAVGQPGGPLRAAEPGRDDPGLLSAGLSTAGLATSLGISLRTTATARLGATAARRVPAARGAVAWGVASPGTARPSRRNL